MDIKQAAADHLRGKLIPFWAALHDDAYGGFYGYMDFALTVDRQAPKGCILNSRILWFFSRAYQLTRDEAILPYAKHALAFLDHFWDDLHGGVYWACAYDGTPLDTMKHTYAQSFAIYGLCAYAEATGDQKALSRAMQLFTLIETRMTDSLTYLEAFDRAFRPLDNRKLSDNPKLLNKGVVAEKTMNTMLHVLEAYTQLYRLTQDARVKAALLALLKTIAAKVYNEKENRLEVFFNADLQTVFDMQSYGHDIEASWLLDLAAAQVLTGDARAEVERFTSALAQGVLQRAYRENSLLNECCEGEVDDTRVWWVQAETVVGLLNLWQKTGEPSLWRKLESVWRYIAETLVDPRAGSEWYWCVDARGKPDGRPIVEPWKCPYHNGRMCMELMARL